MSRIIPSGAMRQREPPIRDPGYLRWLHVGVPCRQQLKNARVALANAHRHGSIDTLHAYFHNLDMNPDVPGLRDGWDTWENYLALLHAARS